MVDSLLAALGNCRCSNIAYIWECGLVMRDLLESTPITGRIPADRQNCNLLDFDPCAPKVYMNWSKQNLHFTDSTIVRVGNMKKSVFSDLRWSHNYRAGMDNICVFNIRIKNIILKCTLFVWCVIVISRCKKTEFGTSVRYSVYPDASEEKLENDAQNQGKNSKKQWRYHNLWLIIVYLIYISFSSLFDIIYDRFYWTFNWTYNLI